MKGKGRRRSAREPREASMLAAVLRAQRSPLEFLDLPAPAPSAGQILVRVLACGLCRTDLHIIDGDLKKPKLPLVLGHEIVGCVERATADASRFPIGTRVGIPWLGWTDGTCRYCLSGRENLCDRARFTGYDIDGGFAQYTVADERYCFALPESYDDIDAAPLMCAGLIGYRSLAACGDAGRVGIYGFGASAHIIAQVALHQGRQIYAFVRDGDEAGRDEAGRFGASWSGYSSETPPDGLDAAIIFAPAGDLVPAALKATVKGGVVVCGGIHMSDIPSFSYDILWEERVIRSVANLTRRDAEEFLAIAKRVPLRTLPNPYPLEKANQAIADFRAGRLTGAAVLIPPKTEGRA
jgi:alcohol dehydrogenase, propanol-preferring